MLFVFISCRFQSPIDRLSHIKREISRKEYATLEEDKRKDLIGYKWFKKRTNSNIYVDLFPSFIPSILFVVFFNNLCVCCGFPLILSLKTPSFH